MPASNADDGGKTIKATENAFTIIEYLSESGGAGVTEIANNVEVSKSTVHNHLKSLEKGEYVVNEGDRYVLGYRFLTLGGKARQRSPLYKAAKPEISWLVEETGETASVATEECGHLVCLYQARGKQAVNSDYQTGTRTHLHCTALGKAILSQYNRDKVNRIIDDRGLPEQTSSTITARNELYEKLEIIRERGYAFDNEERIEGLRCVAVPIVIQDDVYGALSVSGPAKRFRGKWYTKELPETVRRTMRVIEITLKYS